MPEVRILPVINKRIITPDTERINVADLIALLDSTCLRYEGRKITDETPIGHELTRLLYTDPAAVGPYVLNLIHTHTDDLDKPQ